MTTVRPRIDLDGVPLADLGGDGNALAIFRHRTTAGLVLLCPESADFVVPWSAIERAELDLASGRVHLRFTADYAAGQNWLRGAHELVGQWIDRVVIG